MEKNRFNLADRVEQFVRRERWYRFFEGIDRMVGFWAVTSLLMTVFGAQFHFSIWLSLGGAGLIWIFWLVVRSPGREECALVIDQRLGSQEKVVTALEVSTLYSASDAAVSALEKGAVGVLQQKGHLAWRRAPRPWFGFLGLALLVGVGSIFGEPRPVIESVQESHSLAIPPGKNSVVSLNSSGSLSKPKDEKRVNQQPPRTSPPQKSAGNNPSESSSNSPQKKPSPPKNSTPNQPPSGGRDHPARRVGEHLFEDPTRHRSELFQVSLSSLLGPGEAARIRARVRESRSGPGTAPGFGTSEAKELHRHFQKMAEETLRSDRLGQEEKEIIRRYFEAIRPR
ncbi:MAG: hypothetical protein QF752_16700 [Planctomycetota bacterium]|nr:hypothetical protein [Planctomycetota bacterium]